MNLWTPADDGEAIECLEILQQQSDPISYPNKLFVSSSNLAAQEKCIKADFCSSQTSTKQNILYLRIHTKTTIIQQQFCKV